MRAGAADELRRHRDEAVAAAAAREARPEVTVVGVLRRLEVEGGVWVLETAPGPADGERLELLGDVDPRWAGREVVVTGVPRPDLVTTAQVGPVLVVTRGEPSRD